MIGLRLSAKACYNPEAVPAYVSSVITVQFAHCLHRMLVRMGQAEKAQGKLNVDFLYTHPTSENRVKVRSEFSWPSFFHRQFLFCSQMLQDSIPEAHSIQANSPMCIGMQEQFDSFRDTVGLGVDRSFEDL
jgi:hypothetical protein